MAAPPQTLPIFDGPLPKYAGLQGTLPPSPMPSMPSMGPGQLLGKMPGPGKVPDPMAGQMLQQSPGGAPGVADPAQLPMETRQSPYQIRMQAPEPRYRGAPRFFGNVAQDACVPGWAELCVTGHPQHSLAPVPQVEQKSWYNTYVYTPEEQPGGILERHFLERYVQGPDGEWTDIVKCRRMCGYLREREEQKAQEEYEQQAALEALAEARAHHNEGGANAYVDAYSGQPMVPFKGQLVPRHHLQQLCQQSEWQKMLEHQDMGANWDNFRFFGSLDGADRDVNKRVAQDVYNHFDRQSIYVKSDRDYSILELPSLYVDAERYQTFSNIDFGHMTHCSASHLHQ